MQLPHFEYHSPTSLPEAVEWLVARRGDGVRLLGGGTDLLVDIRGQVIPDGHRPHCREERSAHWSARRASPTPAGWLMALSRIPELRGISVDGDHLRIGAMTTISELGRSPLIRGLLTGLAEGADCLGTPLVRNRGTYGGNLCNARPAADTAIPTLALGGRLVLVSARGERIVEHDDFVRGPGETVLAADEILKEIVFTVTAPPFNSPPAEWEGEKKDTPPLSPPGNRGGETVGTPPLPSRHTSSYIKLANRKALEISVVGAAAAIGFTLDAAVEGIEPAGGVGQVTSAAIALGAVAPRPLLIDAAGEALVGGELSPESIAEAARIAAETARPITDHRGGREYRSMMVEVLVRRALHRCRERALSASEREVAP